MLEAKNLGKNYGSHAALNNLNLTIQPGEIFALLGQNGAGKTTTINLFLGFIEPSTGTASINGISVADNPEETKKHLAYIPETVMLYPNLTGLENLEYFSSLAGFDYSKTELYNYFQLRGFNLRLLNKGSVVIQKVCGKKSALLLLSLKRPGCFFWTNLQADSIQKHRMNSRKYSKIWLQRERQF